MEHPSNHLDELLRQRLQGAEVPPPAFVWPEVEKALRRRKRRGIWLLMAGLAIASVFLTLWGRPFSGQRAEHADLARPATIRPAGPDLSLVPPAISEPGHAPSSTDPTLPESTSALSKAGETAVVKQPSTAGGNLKLPANLPNETRTPKGGIPAKSATPNRNSNDLPALAASAEPSAGQPTDAPPATVSAPESPVRKETVELLPDRSLWLTDAHTGHALSPVPPAALPKHKVRKCYDFHNNRQAWLVDAYAGPTFSRKLLYTADPEFKDYIQDRFRTETRGFAYHAGIRASYLFAGNFLIRTGLHYDQFTEKFENIDPNFILYHIVSTQKFVNGVWISALDTTSVEYGANYVKTYNRYGMLEIPLQVALEMRSGATGISLNLGGSANVLFWKRGTLLAPDGQPAVFTSGQKQQIDPYKTRLGLSLMGSIQWFLHLGPRTRVFAEPYYRYIMHPVTRTGYPLEQFYGVGGIKLGVTRILETKVE